MNGKTLKLCSYCKAAPFIKVPYGVLCLNCYRNGIDLAPKLPIKVNNYINKKVKKKAKKFKWLVHGKPVYSLYINSKQWKSKRHNKLRSIGFCCENITCRSKFNLEVHHLTYKRLGKELLKDLQVLCKACHMEAHDNLPFPYKYYI